MRDVCFIVTKFGEVYYSLLNKFVEDEENILWTSNMLFHENGIPKIK